jgi:hypothetical protein
MLNYAQCHGNVNPRVFSTSALHGGEWPVSRPGRFTPGGRDRSIPRMAGWVSPGAGLNAVGGGDISSLPAGVEPRFLGCAARTHSTDCAVLVTPYLLLVIPSVQCSKWSL